MWLYALLQKSLSIFQEPARHFGRKKSSYEDYFSSFDLSSV